MYFLKSSSTLFQTHLILKSFKHWTGKDLISPSIPSEKVVEVLFNSPFILVSHGVEKDPILNYGNNAALNLWEMSWEELTQTPSRLTAEPMNRQERESFLKQVHEKGFIVNYQGVRISKTGKRFRIEKAIVWNLIGENEEYQGQAACFERVVYL